MKFFNNSVSRNLNIPIGNLCRRDVTREYVGDDCVCHSQTEGLMCSFYMEKERQIVVCPSLELQLGNLRGTNMIGGT